MRSVLGGAGEIAIVVQRPARRGEPMPVMLARVSWYTDKESRAYLPRLARAFFQGGPPRCALRAAPTRYPNCADTGALCLIGISVGRQGRKRGVGGSSSPSWAAMYRVWIWCAECGSMDVGGVLWTPPLPGTQNKATIEVFAGHLGEESDWEATTYRPSKRLVSRSKFHLQNSKEVCDPLKRGESPVFISAEAASRRLQPRFRDPCPPQR